MLQNSLLHNVVLACTHHDRTYVDHWTEKQILSISGLAVHMPNEGCHPQQCIMLLRLHMSLDWSWEWKMFLMM